MLDMCKAKQLDIIITKSVNRFGRNTIDVLTALQTLVDLGIRIYFEAEQM
ncbi:MAG: recombinase family protein [Bacilli bacterium]